MFQILYRNVLTIRLNCFYAKNDGNRHKICVFFSIICYFTAYTLVLEGHTRVLIQIYKCNSKTRKI